MFLKKESDYHETNSYSRWRYIGIIETIYDIVIDMKCRL